MPLELPDFTGKAGEYILGLDWKRSLYMSGLLARVRCVQLKITLFTSGASLRRDHVAGDTGNLERSDLYT